MPSVSKTDVAGALAAAISNDQRGIVSEKDARTILAAGLSAIVKAPDPEATFADNQRFFAAARTLLGTSSAALRTLQSYDAQGKNAVTTRLEQLTGTTQLPVAVRERFAEMVDDYAILSGSGAVQISDVHGSARDGFSFRFARHGAKADGFAIEVDGEWVFAPKPITRATVEAARAAALEYFDGEWAPELRNDWGKSAAEVAAIRKQIAPTHVFFPTEESDPNGLGETYPLVFQITNPTGSDHGFYVGLNPKTGAHEAYTFN